MKIGVVILHYRGWPAVTETLTGLYAQTRRPDHVLVVDNGSDDGSVDRIRSAYPALEVVEAHANGGYAAGMNLGHANLPSECDATLFLTHDCRLDAGTLAALADRLDADPEVGVTGPLLCIRSQPDTVFSAGGFVRQGGGRLSHLDGGVSRGAVGSGPRRVMWLDGSCLFVREQAFVGVDGFDTRFFLYFEDADFCMRIAKLGWKIEIVLDALAWQEPGFFRPFLQARNQLLFLDAVGWRSKKLAYLSTVPRELAWDVLRGGGVWSARERLRGIVAYLRGSRGVDGVRVRRD